MADDPLSWLQDFYATLCDGDWEHSYGCDIGNIDNPGWMLKFDFTDTEYETATFGCVRIERSETDWLDCRKEGAIFASAGGVKNLWEMISMLRQFVEAAPDANGQD